MLISHLIDHATKVRTFSTVVIHIIVDTLLDPGVDDVDVKVADDGVDVVDVDVVVHVDDGVDDDDANLNDDV